MIHSVRRFDGVGTQTVLVPTSIFPLSLQPVDGRRSLVEVVVSFLQYHSINSSFGARAPTTRAPRTWQI